MEQVIAGRIERIFQAIQSSRRVQAVFVYNRDSVSRNFHYLTGIDSGVFENCGVLCERSGKMYVFTTTLEEEILRSTEERAEIVVYRNEEERNSQLKKVLSNYNTLGISFEAISHSLYLNLLDLLDDAEMIDVSSAFHRARMIKSPDEIEKVRKACTIVSEVADSFPRFLRENVTELDLAAEIDYQMRKKGAHSAAFQTIVAFAENSSKPHYSGTDVPLKNGDVVLIDFGAEYRGYVSDISRTYLTGKPDKDLIKLYTTVRRAQEIALGLISDGVSVESVEKEVKSYIDSFERYRGRFIHGLGHSIGLEVHDNSYPSSDFDKLFASNMVLTVEPGIYLPGLYGVRIEDDIVVEERSCCLLTSALKEPLTYEI